MALKKKKISFSRSDNSAAGSQGYQHRWRGGKLHRKMHTHMIMNPMEGIAWECVSKTYSQDLAYLYEAITRLCLWEWVHKTMEFRAPTWSYPDWRCVAIKEAVHEDFCYSPESFVVMMQVMKRVSQSGFHAYVYDMNGQEKVKKRGSIKALEGWKNFVRKVVSILKKGKKKLFCCDEGRVLFVDDLDELDV